MGDYDDTTYYLWVEETHKKAVTLRLRVKKTLFEGKSPFQTVHILETVEHGRMLINDGMFMLCERDEFVYHEMISHVPLFLHPSPEKVLVIGGGDGGTVREVLKHPGVKECRLVEIDGMVVEACREFIPSTASALDDPRARVTIDDGVRFVAETDERFDVVLIDSTDPFGAAAGLFDEKFYSNVKKILTAQGIVVAQGESPFYEMEMQKKMVERMASLYERVHIYNYTNLTYPGGFWSFVLATRGLCPIGDFDGARVERANLDLSWYNANLHRGAFAIPEFQRKELGEGLTPIERQ